jgi:hypothetical protein
LHFQNFPFEFFLLSKSREYAYFILQIKHTYWMCFFSVSPGIITFLRSPLQAGRKLRLYLLSKVKWTHFSSHFCIRSAPMPTQTNKWFFIYGFPGLPHFRSKSCVKHSHSVPFPHQKYLAFIKKEKKPSDSIFLDKYSPPISAYLPISKF